MNRFSSLLAAFAAAATMSIASTAVEQLNPAQKKNYINVTRFINDWSSGWTVEKRDKARHKAQRETLACFKTHFAVKVVLDDGLKVPLKSLSGEARVKALTEAFGEFKVTCSNQKGVDAISAEMDAEHEREWAKFDKEWAIFEKFEKNAESK